VVGAASSAAASPLGVHLAGYFDGSLGLASVVRNVQRALERAGVAVTPISLPPWGAPLPAPATSAGHPATVLCVPPGATIRAREVLGPMLAGQRTIGLWWWEVADFPGRWTRAFDGLDEIWVASSYMADILAPVSPVPVVRLPAPVPEPEPDAATRAELGLPDGFLFGSMYDYGSVVERKNPLGAIEAFRRAFDPSERGVALVLKTLRGSEHREQHARVLAAAAADERINVLDADLPAPSKDALLAELDCFVSLHRSEGFGLAIAEAMLLGRPVVATDQGGPRDFMNAFNAYPVDHRPVRVGEGNDPYPPDAEWADPALDHAASLMRQVFERQDEARARGARAREDVLREHAPAAAGTAMAARLGRSLGMPSGATPDVLDLTDLVQRIRGGPEQYTGSRSGGRRALRELVLRALRPYSVYQRLVDEELLRTLRTLDERVRGAVAGQQALAAELREQRAEHGDEPVSPSSPLER
jgi:hypothetical protein